MVREPARIDGYSDECDENDANDAVSSLGDAETVWLIHGDDERGERARVLVDEYEGTEGTRGGVAANLTRRG